MIFSRSFMSVAILLSVVTVDADRALALTPYNWGAKPLINNHNAAPSHYGYGYPAVVRDAVHSNVLVMFRGGFADEACSAGLLGAVCPPPIPKSEGIYMSTSWAWDAENWSAPAYAFQILASTMVYDLNGNPTGLNYAQTYPGVFKYDCPELANSYCHVQINDPSVVVVNENGINTYFLYFSILENYRFYDSISISERPGNGTLLSATHARRWTHSIGLATSTDRVNWKFRGKVVPETSTSHTYPGSQVRTVGAWAPSAVKVANDVLIFFHNAPGHQYVATLGNGKQLAGTPQRLDSDSVWRTNLDVVYSSIENRYQMLYNRADAAGTMYIARMQFATDFSDYAQVEETVVYAPGVPYVTPNQFVTDDYVLHLYFNDSLADRSALPNNFHHWYAGQPPNFVIFPM